MNEPNGDVLSRRLTSLEPRVDATVASRSALAAALRKQRALRTPVVLAIAVVTATLVALSSSAEAQNWFAEVFRIGNVSGAASRAVSLSEARTTGLPLPASSELPGGWKLQEREPVHMTRTPTWTTVSLQYERDGLRGLNVTTMRGISMFVPGTDPYDETLVVSGRTVYVDRSHGEVQVFVRVDDVEISIHGFGPALAGSPLTVDHISDLVRSLIG